jgi:GNAT superfamily N-acetyltransferase
VTQVEIMLMGAQPMLQRFEIRPLIGDDAPEYFALRQKILKMGDGHYFCDSYTREAQLTTEQQRRDWCTEKHEHCIIGAFANNALSGIVMVTRFGPPEDSTVEWEAAWVDPRYRRTGLTKTIYQQVQQWTTDQGYSFVKVFIRSDNTRWLDIRRRLGFTQVDTKRNELWADGTTGDTCVFRFDLHAPTPKQRRQQTLLHLDETVASLNQGAPAPPKRRNGDTTPPHLKPPLDKRGCG